MAQATTTKSAQTLIIGSGISGIVAALAAAQAGGDVLVVGQKPGGTAQWSGVADVFGSVLRDPATGEVITEAGPRLASLLQRRRRHPYGVLGMRDAAQVEAYWGRAAQLWDGLVDVNARGWCATGLGVPRWADGASPTVAPGVVATANAAGDVVFVGLEGFSGLDAMQAAATYKTLGKQIGGAEARGVRGVCLSLGLGGEVWDEEPSAMARRIEGILGEDFVGRFKAIITQTQLERAGEAQTRWLFPAVLGRDLGTAEGAFGGADGGAAGARSGGASRRVAGDGSQPSRMAAACGVARKACTGGGRRARGGASRGRSRGRGACRGGVARRLGAASRARDPGDGALCGRWAAQVWTLARATDRRAAVFGWAAHRGHWAGSHRVCCPQTFWMTTR